MKFMHYLQVTATWLLAILWVFPLLYAFWAAFHTGNHFDLFSSLTLENFRTAMSQAPFLRYMINTVILVTITVVAQLFLCTFAAYAFARINFLGRNIVFFLVLLQLMVTPEILIMKNYQILSSIGLTNTILGIGLPYMASAFGIFLLRQAFKTIPRELEDAARIEGSSTLGILWRVYIPLSKPTYLAYALVSISYHWNNFLWPLVVSSSKTVRPITVGLAIFASPETGVNWSVISAATILSIAPLLAVFLLFQKQFVNSFLYTGIK